MRVYAELAEVTPTAARKGLVAGICLRYGILFLFVGQRRILDKRLNLTFALFAFGYAGTLLLGIWYRSQTTVPDYLAGLCAHILVCG